MTKLKKLMVKIFTNRAPELDPDKCGVITIYSDLKPSQLKQRIFRISRKFEITAFNENVIGYTKDYDKIYDILVDHTYVPLSSYSLLYNRRTMKRNI